MMDYENILDMQRLDVWLRRLAEAELFALHIQVAEPRDALPELVGLAFAVQSEQAAYLPCAHDDPDAGRQLSRGAALPKLAPLLQDPARHKVGQDLKYAMGVLARYGIELRGIAHDTMLESYLLDSTMPNRDLDSMAKNWLQRDLKPSYKELVTVRRKRAPFSTVPLDSARRYACERVDVALLLHETLSRRLHEEPQLEQLYRKMEMPLLGVLSRMEQKGVMIDPDMLREQSHALREEVKRLEERAYDLVGRPFNIASPKQLQAILYDEMKLPVLKKTPKKQPSTAESVLQELVVEGHELPAIILEVRGLEKLCSTYADGLVKHINPSTGRVHTRYQQAVVVTGRLSSTVPNLQNIPARSGKGRRIRRAFVSPPGYVLLAADYSQIELRIMAHLSGDEALLSAFARGDDVHKCTAAEVFGVAPEQVSADQRRAAKAINFGLIYGMSAFGLSRQLDVEPTEAEEYMKLYFSRYPQVLRYMQSACKQAREQGYVETLFHRRLRLPDIRAKDAARRHYAERAAINAPMQGTAADIIKLAMIKIDAWLREAQLDASMIMQVHDELVFEIAEQDAPRASATIRELMSGVAEPNVPLEVDIAWGKNWDEAH